MLYYCGLIISIIFLRLITLRLKQNDRKIFFFLTTFLVVCFQGLRSFSVGTDLANYIPSYSYIGKYVPFSVSATYKNYEAGYILLNKIIYKIGLDQRGFLIVVTILIQIPIFYTIYKYSENPLLSILAYFAFGNFIMTFSGLRQAISMSFCFYAYVFIKKKKLLKYIITVLIACLFHKSAIICLLLYPLYYIRIKRIVFPFILLGIALCFLFRYQIFIVISKLYYGEAKNVRATGAYTMFVMFLLLYIVAYILQSQDEEYRGLMNILPLIVCIYSLASIHDFVTRMSYPLSLYLTLFIPKVVNRFKTKLKEKDGIVIDVVSNVLCIVCFMIFLGGLDTLPFSFL